MRVFVITGGVFSVQSKPIIVGEFFYLVRMDISFPFLCDHFGDFAFLRCFPQCTFPASMQLPE